jgi:hypothetical protein
MFYTEVPDGHLKRYKWMVALLGFYLFANPQIDGVARDGIMVRRTF